MTTGVAVGVVKGQAGFDGISTPNEFFAHTWSAFKDTTGQSLGGMSSPTWSWSWFGAEQRLVKKYQEDDLRKILDISYTGK